jgi:PadR family transcriptional regulator, regulatory protein PadR
VIGMESKRNKPKEEKDGRKNIVGSPKNFVLPVLLLLLKDWNAHGYELMQKLVQFGFDSIDHGTFIEFFGSLKKMNL